MNRILPKPDHAVSLKTRLEALSLRSDVASILLGIILASTLARLSPAQSNPVAKEDGTTFRSDVNLVLTPVVIRDKNGRPVDDLTQDDFELFDKGKRQTITSFSVVRHRVRSESPFGGTPAAATGAVQSTNAGTERTKIAADRHIIYLFDDLNVSFADLARIREAAVHHFKTALAANDRAAIRTFSGRFSSPFTGDHARLEETALKLRSSPSSGHTVTPCPNVSYYLADLILSRSDDQALKAVAKQTVECQHVPYFMAEKIAADAARQELLVGEQETYVALLAVKNAIRLLAQMPGERLIVLASPGFFSLVSGSKAGVDNILALAAKNQVTINALDVRGVLTVGLPEASRSTEMSKLEIEYYAQSERASAEVLDDLANGSGGLFFHSNNDLTQGLAKVTAVVDTSYVLGFTPSQAKSDGSFRSLKVRLTNGRKLSVQARRGYYALAASRPAAVAAEIDDAVFSREERNDLHSHFRMEVSKSISGDAKLAVITKVDPKGLHFETIDGRNCDSLKIIAALFDTEGGYVAGTAKTVNLRLREQTIVELKTGIDVRSEFTVKPGVYFVRVVVRDLNGNTMSAENGAVPIH